MKKLAVVFPVHKDNRWSYIALAAALEKRQVRNVDLIWLNLDRSKDNVLLNAVKALLVDHERIVLAYSFMSSQWLKIRDEWALVRNSFPEEKLFILAGGPHPSGAVKGVLESGCWVAVAGEGEEIFPELVNVISKGALHEIPHGCYRLVDGKVKGARAPSVTGWEESFPFPKAILAVGPIEITRGCPFKCSYCATPVLKGTAVRHRNVDVIVEAVRFMVRHGKKDIRFITPNALSYGSATGREPDIEKLELLLDGVKKVLPSEGRIFFGSFPSEVRPEFVNPDTVDVLKRYCANRQIVIGAQSGSDRMLKLMRRGHTVENVLSACDLIAGAGFVPVVDMMFGLPYEDEEDVKASLELMDKLSRMGARIHAHHFMPLPGSRWSGLPPAPISDSLRRRLERLIAAGKLFGQWARQQEVAVSNYLLAKSQVFVFKNVHEQDGTMTVVTKRRRDVSNESSCSLLFKGR